MAKAPSQLACSMARSMWSRSWAGRAALSAGIDANLPLLQGPAMVAGVVPLGALDVAALGAGVSLPGEGGWAAGVAFAVELGDGRRAEGGVLLLAADPPVQLGAQPFSGGQHDPV